MSKPWREITRKWHTGNSPHAVPCPYCEHLESHSGVCVLSAMRTGIAWAVVAVPQELPAASRSDADSGAPKDTP